MGANKDTNFSKDFKYQDSQDVYTFRLRKKRSWWWILLLLLPLLLLIRCNHDITVTVVDGKTKDPIEGISITAEYTSHIPLKDGKLLCHQNHSYDEVTDDEGKAVLKDVECSVFSYIFYGCKDIHIVADDLIEVDKPYHYTRNVLIEMENVDCEMDLVMCIDNTGSMSGTINMVKKNALNFYEDLNRECLKRHRNVKSFRLRVIPFGDLSEEPIISSESFQMPSDQTQYSDFVSKINAHGGGDEPESGLEALAMAIQSDWHKSDLRLRHVIVVYTDASTHDLGETESSSHYPEDMPGDFSELTKMWDKMNHETRRLVLFAPDAKSWNRISSEWEDVSHQKSSLSVVLSGKGYEEVLEAICKSL